MDRYKALEIMKKEFPGMHIYGNSLYINTGNTLKPVYRTGEWEIHTARPGKTHSVKTYKTIESAKAAVLRILGGK